MNYITNSPHCHCENWNWRLRVDLSLQACLLSRLTSHTTFHMMGKESDLHIQLYHCFQRDKSSPNDSSGTAATKGLTCLFSWVIHQSRSDTRSPQQSALLLHCRLACNTPLCCNSQINQCEWILPRTAYYIPRRYLWSLGTAGGICHCMWSFCLSFQLEFLIITPFSHAHSKPVCDLDINPVQGIWARFLSHRHFDVVANDIMFWVRLISEVIPDAT